ncbi:MAG: biopolymer transporter ExbD [Planctomycetes bacterium]|nr:biopolymer transporter ExbD [Planctomycetota bacterium]
MANLDAVKEDAKLDMTPMIDCVFLLMIFFVLVIDLSQTDLEDLILPKAKYVQPDDQPPDVRPIANINQGGDVIYKGNTYYAAAQHGENYEGMKKLLVEWRNTLKLTYKPLKEGQAVSAKNPNIPDDPVLVRADKWTEWHYVGKFMTACSQPYAQFWKLELAMSEIDKEDKMLKAQKAK